MPDYSVGLLLHKKRFGLWGISKISDHVYWIVFNQSGIMKQSTYLKVNSNTFNAVVQKNVDEL